MTTPRESFAAGMVVGEVAQFQSTPADSCAILDRDRVVLLCARLDESPDTVARLRALLSDDECRRADRYCFEKDRRRFIVARGTLRSLVCRFLGGDPREPRFAYAPNGKPYLPESRLQFNLSHSHELAVYAFSWGRVGVDVEHVAGVRSFAEIAERYFSPGERALLAATPAEQRQRRFFAIWALKEAFVKATGEGMAAMRASNTMYDSVGDACFEPTGRPGETGGWAFSTFALDADYVGAWCVESR